MTMVILMTSIKIVLCPCFCVQHMLPDRAYEEHYPQLQSIVSKILLKRSSNFVDLFSHDKFMPFIDMFQKESVKVILLHIRLHCHLLLTYLLTPYHFE